MLRRHGSSLSQAADQVLGSPERNFLLALGFVAIVWTASICSFLLAGWSFADSFYMVTVTIFTVGFEEVRPIDTTYLRTTVIATIVFGCTGMIVLTGALVQIFTQFQLRRMLGLDRMHSEIESLRGHIIIAGWGRIGMQLARELINAKRAFVVIDRDPQKAEQARGEGCLALVADAEEEHGLHLAGIEHARTLATVLPDDATNVFITLTARSLNPAIEIIARGEAPTTENKLYHAGADKVVLPTHIGAERIAEMILYPSTASHVSSSGVLREAKSGLHDIGLELEVLTVPKDSAFVSKTVAFAEQQGRGSFFVIQIDRANGQTLTQPGEEVTIEAGDTLLLVVRGSRISAGAIFASPI